MKSAGKARNNGLYRHIRTSKEIIRNLLNDYTKDIATDLYIYVIDESRMSKKKTDTDFREELEQRAIVRKVIHLQ